MRTTIRTLGIAAAAFVSAIGVANAGDPYQVSPESRAYLGFSFGGDKVAPRDLHYGLRVDQDSRFLPDAQTTPSILQFDFTRRGFADTRVNGLSVIKRNYRLRQNEGGSPPPAEGGAAAPAEEEGFFSGMWHGIKGFFGGLFGSSEEKPAEAGAAPAPAPEAAAPAEAASAGGWSAIDWGLLAVGVAGVGLAGASSIGKSETPDANAPGGVNNPPGGGGGGTPPPACVIPPGTPGFPNGFPVPCQFTSIEHNSVLGERQDASRQDWLDEGTGHMGDLSPQN